MKLVIVQMDIDWNDAPSNLARIEKYLSGHNLSEGTLLLLPEMFPCGFSAPTTEKAREFEQQGAEFLLQYAKKNKVWIAGTLPSSNSEGLLFNRLLAAGPCGETYQYDKLHLFPLSDEGTRYAAGSSVGVPIAIEGLKTAFTICYDLRFSYLFWQRAPHTDLFIVLANWPAVRDAHWRILLQARAIENQCYVVGVNRVGQGGGVQYCGSSLVISPGGEIVLDCQNSEGLFECEIDSGVVENYRQEFPFLRDRIA